MSDGIVAVADGADVGIVAIEPVFGGLAVESIVIISPFASVAFAGFDGVADFVVAIAAGFAELVSVGFATIEGVVGELLNTDRE
jgi:hypothetical protein